MDERIKRNTRQGRENRAQMDVSRQEPEKQFVSSMLAMLNDEDNYGTANSKLMQLTFVYEISKLPKKDVDELITQLLFLAQKRGQGFGPFGKIY